MRSQHKNIVEASLEYHVTSNRIAASAGTGKTYQLASRYIALLVLGAKPEEIIALTFTRKAAGEFRNRILHALAEGADDKAHPKNGRNELAVRVWEVLSGLSVIPTEYGPWEVVDASNEVALLPVTSALVRYAASLRQYPEELYNADAELQSYYKLPPTNAATFSRLLANVVAVLSKLKLSTIDSFFSSLVATNSLELGMNNAAPLDPASEIAVRAEAIRYYLDEHGSDNEKRLAFLDMFRCITEGVGNSTIPQMEKNINDFLRLYHELPPTTQWGNIEAFESSADFRLATDEEMISYADEQAALKSLLAQYGTSLLEERAFRQLVELSEGGMRLKLDAQKLINHYENLPLLMPAVQLLIQAYQSGLPFSPEVEAAVSLWEKQGSKFKEASKHKAAVTNIIKSLRGELKRKLSAAQENSIAQFAAAVKIWEIDAGNAPLIRIVQAANTLAKLAIPRKLRLTAERTAALRRLLADYAAIYDEHVKAAGQLSFDDIARLAQELMLRNEADEHLLRHHVAYRMGGLLRHWMLDEFQDTSEAQFETLTPLLQPIAEEAQYNAIDFADEQWREKMPTCLREYLKDGETHHVAKESLFIVGDTKQSIYGFRTGKTDVFERLAAMEPWKTPLRSSLLQRSFRSSPIIMQFVNELFAALGQVETPPDGNLACIEQPAVQFSHDFLQHSSATNIPGFVEMTFVAPPCHADGEESQKTRILEQIVTTLRKLTVEDKTPKNGMSIAILVRSNDNADEILNYLRDAMPELPTLLVKDSLAAVACPMGEMLLYFFKWLLHPSDAAALNVCKVSFLGGLMVGDSSQLHAAWMRDLQSIGYYGVVQRLLAELPLEDTQENASVIRCWVREAIAFDASGGELTEWVNRMKNLSVQAAGASGAVQIMTMHKSKGLEFDAVILPYISVEATDTEKKLGYFISEDYRSFILPPGPKDEWGLYGSAFTSLVTKWQQKQRQEEYNLLYVAVTRAKRANYIIGHGVNLFDSKKESFKSAARSVAGLLRQACAYMPGHHEINLGELESNQTYITMGTPDWYESLANKQPALLPQYAPTPLGPAIVRRSRISPSSLAQAEDKPVVEVVDTPANIRNQRFAYISGAGFGTQMHACWEELVSLAEKPVWLQPQAPRTEVQEVVYQALQQPAVAALFTPQSGVSVYNEQAIEAINEHNEWISATIDRLLLTHDDSGRVIAAHIIDFKTNRPSPKDGFPDFYTWLCAHYKAQMMTYRNLVAAAFSIPSSAIELSLISCPKDYVHYPAKVCNLAQFV